MHHFQKFAHIYKIPQEKIYPVFFWIFYDQTKKAIWGN